MTGSKKAFIYEADDGVLYGVTKDESAAEAQAGGVTLFQPFVNGTPNIPCGLQRRYVNAVLSTDANIKRKFEIGRPTVFSALTGGSQIVEAAGGQALGGTYNVSFKSGERSRVLTAVDTGQTDGDG